MTRFLHKLMRSLQQVKVKSSSSNSYNIEIFSRIFNRYFSHKNKHPVKLAYELFEPKGGSQDHLSPLIFLHGIASSKEATWGDIPQTIADQTKRKTYNLDARNHGDSEWSEEFDFDLNATDLLHFIEEHRIPKVVIIGHSMGGITCIKAALGAPEKIEMLFVEDIYVKKVPQVVLDEILIYLNLWKAAAKLIPSKLNKDEADSFITEYVLRKTRPQKGPQSTREPRYSFSYPLSKDSFGRFVFKVNLDVVLEKMKNAESIMTENEGIYEGPSYFLHATKSAYQVGKEKIHILKHFPKTVFIPFEGSKHFLHKEFPDQFIEIIVKYIKLNEKESMMPLAFRLK